MTHLHVHSRGSIYDGVSDVTELVDRAAELNQKAIAITDHGVMSELFKFQQYAKTKDIKPILGIEGYLVDELMTVENKKRKRGHYNHIILLAANETGWKNLCHLNYIANVDEEHFYYKPRNTFEELFQYKEGIVVGSACLASVFSQNVLNNNLEKAEQYFKRFVDEFGDNFYAEVQLNELTQEQKKYNDWIIEMAKKYNVLVVLTGDVHYVRTDGADTQRFIFNLRKDEDSEGDDTYKCKSLFLQSVEDFQNFNVKFGYNYSQSDIETWCKNSDLIAEKCNFTIPLGIGMKLPRVCFDEEKEFSRLAKEGLAKHFNCDYEDCPKEYRDRLEYEIKVLLKKGAHRYMMTVATLVNHSKEKGFMMGSGRGSACGALMNACLGISSWSLDPLKYGLIFERFVSEDRLKSCTYNYCKSGYYITKNKSYSFDDLKDVVAKKIKEFPEYKERVAYELRRAEWLKNEFSVYDQIMEVECDDRYVLPFFLGKTQTVDLSKPLELVQVKEGGAGGLDIDLDFQPEGKEEIKQWLIEKYGKDRVISVAAYGTVGLASGIKDILRKCNVPFKESNEFCKELNDDMCFEENMDEYREKFPHLYQIYEMNQIPLNFTSKIIGIKKNIGVHAGGVVILDKPIWEYIPVVHTKDGVATAFCENGSNAELDEMGIVKIDCLAITVLSTISNAVDMIKEELVKIEEDGIVKIVPRSYINGKM